ncbi:MAG TPA: hypothetical protein VFY82_01655, partial [Acidimicrobiales bacterium]|nr:hypothetical protein [Acidimicrobiales bacterium]
GAAVRSQRWSATLRGAERIVLATADGEGVELVCGRPVRWWAAPDDASGDDPKVGHDDDLADDLADDCGRDLARIAFGPLDAIGPDDPLAPAVADELACVASWIERHAPDLRLLHVDGELSSPLPRRPTGVARHLSPAGLRCAAC